MSLIEKIDSEIIEARHGKQYDLNAVEYRVGIAKGLEIAKKYILSEHKEPITIGDKIRGSNESLAKLILNSGNSCKKCAFIKNVERCKNEPCNHGILAYLNQPYTE